MKTVTLNNNVYIMPDKLASQLISTARTATAGHFTIYALLKGDQVQMRKDTYATNRELQRARAGYIREGFSVRYHTRGKNAS